MAPLDALIGDTAVLVEALRSLDFEEARFRCREIVWHSDSAPLREVQACAAKLFDYLDMPDSGELRFLAYVVADLIGEVSAAAEFEWTRRGADSE